MSWRRWPMYDNCKPRAVCRPQSDAEADSRPHVVVQCQGWQCRHIVVLVTSSAASVVILSEAGPTMPRLRRSQLIRREIGILR
jgi:hypothetical protein